MATIDLDELKREIEVDRKALAEKEAVLRFLEARQGRKPVAQGVEQSEKHDQEALFTLDELVPESGRQPLIEHVKEILPRFGDQEFTVVHVDAALKQIGVEVSGRLPRSRLSTILGKLDERGVVTKTFQGAGNVPNKYKVAKDDDL